jgi:hypothetical protein
VAAGLLAAGLVATGVAVSDPADAADLARRPAAPWAETAAPSPWTVTVASYFWATSLNGTSTVKGRTTAIDAGFVKIIEDSKIPVDLLELAGAVELRNDRFAVLADIVYTHIAVNRGLSRSRGTARIGGTLGLSAGIDIEMVVAEAAAAYELLRWGGTGAPGSGTALDVYGGVRGWWQQVDASFDLAGTLQIGDLRRNSNRTLTASGDVSWADPIIGLRLRHQFAPNLNLTVSGDVGGFGVGSSVTWQSVAALYWDFYATPTVTWSAVAGYRALYADYQQGSGNTEYQYDMTMHGPILGLTAKF